MSLVGIIRLRDGAQLAFGTAEGGQPARALLRDQRRETRVEADSPNKRGSTSEKCRSVKRRRAAGANGPNGQQPLLRSRERFAMQGHESAYLSDAAPAGFSPSPRLSGIREKTALLHAGLEALIARESARRLAALGGTERKLGPIPRRRPRLAS